MQVNTDLCRSSDWWWRGRAPTRRGPPRLVPKPSLAIGFAFVERTIEHSTEFSHVVVNREVSAAQAQEDDHLIAVSERQCLLDVGVFGRGRKGKLANVGSLVHHKRLPVSRRTTTSARPRPSKMKRSCISLIDLLRVPGLRPLVQL